MKHILLLLSAVTLLFGTSCVKTPSTPAPAIPSGVFNGQFLYIHGTSTAHLDTLKAALTVTMTTPGNTFSVTGDTSAHAGSYGNFSFISGLIYFSDKTYPTNGSIPAKLHLSGTYQYLYDGINFQLVGASSDTSVYKYNLKKN